MSSEDTARPPSDRPGNSEEPRVEIHLLACGHGDTILLRLPGDRWILVDCHLRDLRTRHHFFDFVRSRGIDRLDFIFQTHPDFDHFCGMGQVLDHFTSEGRSVRYWCDGGLGADQVRDLLWEEELSEREYAKLHRRLDELSHDDLIEIVAVNDWTKPISPSGYSDSVHLFVVAPPATLARKITRRDIGKLGIDAKAKLESNALSLVMVLSTAAGDVDCNMLLSADGSVDEMLWALETWHRRAEEYHRVKSFDVIKVPHHGSMKSHTPALCDAKRKESTARIAAISAGTRRALPDKEVIRAYLNEEWLVLLTTTRTTSRRANYGSSEKI
ncbi:MAG TPA: MBL fold metallo-hydrolase [Thermoguttaceae bacterium]|nr:MBL fold metallo-hydrolase [Thermoguttaceae bacterium]